MTDEQQLRAVVREVIAQRLGHGASGDGHRAAPPSEPRAHASHGLLRMVVATQQDGPCVIEPQVMCDHCGYCKSLGH